MADLTGMLTGLNDAILRSGSMALGQPTNKTLQQQDAMERAGVTNPMLQIFGRGLGGMLGTDMRSTGDKSAEIMARALQSSDTAMLRKLASEMAKIGDQANAVELINRANEIDKTAQTNLARNADIKAAIAAIQQGVASGRIPRDVASALLQSAATGKLDSKEAAKYASGQVDFGSYKGDTSKVTSVREVPPALVNQLRARKDDPIAKIHLETLTPSDPNAKIDRGAIAAATTYLSKAAEGEGMEWAKKFTTGDWSSIEGLRDIRIEALKNDEPELANAIANQIEDLTAEGRGVDVTKAAAAMNEAMAGGFDEIKRIRNLASQFRSFGDLEAAGLPAIRERLTSALASDDVRALAAFNMFLQSKSVYRRIADNLSKWATGDVSDATVQDYKNIMSAMEEFMRQEVSTGVKNLRAAGGTNNKAYANFYEDVYINSFGGDALDTDKPSDDLMEEYERLNRVYEEMFFQESR